MTENPRHREFARRIIWHRDTAAEAYRRAGFKAKGTSAQTSGAHKTLKLPAVQAMMEEERARLAESLRVDEQRIADELSAIAFSDVADVLEWFEQNATVEPGEGTPTLTLRIKSVHDIPAHVRRCIKDIKATNQGITVSMHDKLTALGYLAKALGMIVDKSEVTGKDGGPVETKADFSALIGAFQAAGHGGDGTSA